MEYWQHVFQSRLASHQLLPAMVVLIFALLSFLSTALGHSQLWPEITSVSANFKGDESTRHGNYDLLEINLSFSFEDSTTQTVRSGDFFDFSIEGNILYYGYDIESFNYTFPVVDRDGKLIFQVSNTDTSSPWTFRATATDLFDLETIESLSGEMVIETIGDFRNGGVGVSVSVGNETTRSRDPVEVKKVIHGSPDIHNELIIGLSRIIFFLPVNNETANNFVLTVDESLKVKETYALYFDTQKEVASDDLPLPKLQGGDKKGYNYTATSSSFSVIEIPPGIVQASLAVDVEIVDKSQSRYCASISKNGENLTRYCVFRGLGNDGLPGGKGKANVLYGGERGGDTGQGDIKRARESRDITSELVAVDITGSVAVSTLKTVFG